MYVELDHERVGAHPRPVPMVEELVLQPPEEPLARRVVGAAPLCRHASDQSVLVADPYPLRPPVVPAAVRVDRRRRAGPPLGDRLLETRVGEALAGVPADRPRRGPAVEAVDHGAEVDLVARRQADLPERRIPVITLMSRVPSSAQSRSMVSAYPCRHSEAFESRRSTFHALPQIALYRQKAA